MDWNAANMGDMSSRHPVGPSLLAQKMHAVKVAIREADAAAEVSTAEYKFLG